MTNRTLEDLWSAIDDLQMGLLRSPIGPGGIRGKQIKPKAVTAGLINVSDLESVNTKTGSLSVTGDIAMTAAGSFSAGMTDYLTGVGWWLDMTGATPRFAVGNSGGSHISWNGTTLNVVGTITASAGVIGGFTIGAADLTAGSGSSSIGLSSAGAVRLWMGNATPASAPFQVSSLGALTAKSGSVGGWTIDDINGLILGSGASTRGISTGATAFYAGSATPSGAPFNVSTAGVVTCANVVATGGSVGGLTIGASSLTIPAGKTLTNADGDEWNSAGIILNSAGSYGDSIQWKNGSNVMGSIHATTAAMTVASQNSSAWGSLELGNSYAKLTAANGSNMIQLGGAASGWVDGNNSIANVSGDWIIDAFGSVFADLGDGAGAESFKVRTSTGTQALNVTSAGRVYPGNQSAGYLAWDGANVQVAGADLYVGNYLKVAQSGAASATPGNCTKYVAMKDSGGATVYVPAYTSAAFSD